MKIIISNTNNNILKFSKLTYRIAMAGGSLHRNVPGSTHVTNLMNNMTRSERDLTKVTKVRVRTNTKENSAVPGTFIKQRTKMKTTTMIVSDNSGTPASCSTSTALQTTGNRDLVNNYIIRTTP